MIGQSIHSGDREFEIPDSYEVRTKSLRMEGNRRFIRVPGVRWYTNIDIPCRHEPLTLFRRYSDDPSKYPHYDNYPAINVDKVADIPEDYEGVMGVPITFLDKYCPEQFELIGSDFEVAQPVLLENGKIGRDRFYVANKRLYSRIAIRQKK